jgi:hypothetical protein
VLVVAFVAFAVASPSVRADTPVGLIVGPVRVRAYQMILDAGVREPGTAPAVSIQLHRDQGKIDSPAVYGRQFDEMHTFLVRGAHVRIAADFKTATVQAVLPGYGRVDLTVTTPPPSHPKSCLANSGVGVARGIVQLRPGGRYFRTIRRTRLAAQIIGNGVCSGAPAVRARELARRIGLYGVTASQKRNGRIFYMTDSPSGVTIGLIRAGGRVYVQDLIDATLPPPSTLVSAPDLATATLRAFGPFLSGTATYTAHTALKDGCTRGTLSGDFKARFDSPGPVPLPTGGVRAELGKLVGFPSHDCP